MTDVVGLRFVTEGYEEAQNKLAAYERITTDVLGTVTRVAGATQAVQASLQQLNRLYDQGAVEGEAYRRSLNEIAAQFAALSGTSITKARQEIIAFNQAMEEQKSRAADDSARQGFERLVASLDPATAAVQRFEQAMQTLDAAQARGVITAREYTETQARLVERLNATRTAADAAARQGFERLAASLDPVLAATQRYEQRLATIRDAEARGQVTTAEAVRVRERVQRAYDAEVAKLSGLESAQIRAQRAELEAIKTKEQTARAYDQLLARIDPVVAAQQRFAATERTVDAAIRAGIITKQQGVATMQAYRASLSAMEQAALQTTTATSRIRQQFLATANTIAILDGPLGGIASRFSAFGVLIGRTGLILGTLFASFTAFSFLVARSIAIFSQYEREMAKINAVLQTTRYEAGLTAADIDHLAERIALSTLSSSNDLRQAAAQLLTFRNVGKDSFETVLRTATDMAALGFGTVQSEAVKLAKALEDPNQSLTSLSRSGITFTRAQRALIISLVETGFHAEALEKILEGVNRQVGGAAQREAETFAGKIDTISQAFGLLFRQLGESAVAEDTPGGRLLSRMAANADVYVREVTQSLAEQEANLRRQITQTTNTLEIYGEQVALLQRIVADQEQAMQARRAAGLPTLPFGTAETRALGEYQERIRVLTEEMERLQNALAAVTGQQIDASNTQLDSALRRITDQMADLDQQTRTTLVEMLPTGLDVFVQKALAASQTSDSLGASVAAARAELADLARTTFEFQRSARLVSDLRSAVDQTPEMAAAMRAQLEFFGQTTQQARVQQELRRQEYRIQEQISALEARRAGASAETVASLDAYRTRLLDALSTLRLTRGEVLAIAAAMDQAAVDAQRADAQQLGLQRIGAMREEVRLLEAIAQYGQESAEVADVRLSTLVAQTQEFISQNELMDDITKSTLLELTTRLFIQRAGNQRLQSLQQERQTLATNVSEQSRMVELMQRGNTEERARVVLAAEQRNLQLEQVEAAAKAVLATAELGSEAERAARETLRLVQEARQLPAAFNSASRAAAAITSEVQRAANAVMSLRSELIALGSESRLAGLEAEVRVLERGGDAAAAAAERVRATLRADPRYREVLAGGIASEVAQFDAMIERSAQAEAAMVRLQERRAAATRSERGGGSDTVTSIYDTIAALDERIRREEHLITLTQDQRRVMETFYTLKDANDQADIRMTEERLMRYAEEFAARERLIEQKRREQEMAERLGNSLGNLFLAATEGANAFRNALSGVLRSLASMLANAAFRGILGGPGRGLMGAISGAWGALVPSANGNVIAGGNVIPFANGGIVGSPTTFPMQGGKTGLMGEAGPEAIIPLRRGRDGKLGVSGQTQQVEVDVRVHMDENGNWKANVERIADKRVQQQAPTIVRQSVQATYAANSERRMP